MPSRRRAARARGENQMAKAGLEDKPNVQAQTIVQKDPPKESNFRIQVRHAVYRLIGILIITLLTKQFKPSVTKFRDEVKPWKVVELPGRGKGVIATRLIKQGERIITERPLFTVPRQITGSPMQLISAKLEGLAPDQRAAFYDLSYADLDIADGSVPLSIFQTNAISAGSSGVGLFPMTARLNHACSAGFNSVYSWRAKEELLVLHALKDIQSGEELLTTYFDTKKRRDERRNHLENAYKFDCSCQVCSLPEEESRASDIRLQSMSALHAKLTTWGKQEINGIEALDLVRDIWHTGEEEGYWSERGQLAADAAHVAAAHSDEHAARQWASLAQEWYGYELGQDSEQVESMRILVETPQQYGAWASRNKMIVGGLNYIS